MLRILNEEGFDLKERELMRVRAKNCGTEYPDRLIDSILNDPIDCAAYNKVSDQRQRTLSLRSSIASQLSLSPNSRGTWIVRCIMLSGSMSVLHILIYHFSDV